MNYNRRSQPIHISKLINNGNLSKDPLFILVKNWRAITGEIIYKASYPMKIKETCLIVAVKNHAWIQELNMSKQLLLDNIKKFTSCIDDVQFILDLKKRT